MATLSTPRRSLWEAQLARLPVRERDELHDEMSLIWRSCYGLPNSVRFVALVVCKRAGLEPAMAFVDDVRDDLAGRV